jgi:hypothetical protein
VSLTNLAVKCYGDRLDYVDQILDYTSKALKGHGKTPFKGEHDVTAQQPASKPLVRLLRIPLESGELRTYMLLPSTTFRLPFAMHVVALLLVLLLLLLLLLLHTVSPPNNSHSALLLVRVRAHAPFAPELSFPSTDGCYLECSAVVSFLSPKHARVHHRHQHKQTVDVC